MMEIIEKGLAILVDINSKSILINVKIQNSHMLR